MKFESDYDKKNRLEVRKLDKENDILFETTQDGKSAYAHLRLPKVIQLRNYLTQQIELQQQKENTEMREKFTIAKLLIALKNRNESQMLSLNSSEQADLIPEIEKLLSELEKYKQENSELTKCVHNKVNSVISGEQNKALEQMHLRLIQKYNSNQNLSLDRKEIGEIADQIKRLFKENELLLLQNDVLKNENNTLNQECARRIVENEKCKKENEGLKEKHNTLFDDREVEKDNYTLMYNKLSRDYEKLKSENENHLASLGIYDEVLNLIPNVFDNNLMFNRAVAESFIKNALAKERVSGLYIVDFILGQDTSIREIARYNEHTKIWNVVGNSTPYMDRNFSYISSTPIDLGELK